MTQILHQELDYIDPQLIFDLVAHDIGTIFLDSLTNHEHYAKYSYILINPLTQYIAQDNNSLQQQIEQWKILLQNNQQNNPNLPPFQGGIAGYFSYDLVREIEYLPTTKPLLIPSYHLGLYNQIFAFDHINKKCYAYVCNVKEYNLDLEKQFSDLMALYTKAKNISAVAENVTLPKLNLVSNLTQDKYIESVQKTIEYIRNGDIFEVNLSQCFSAKIDTNYPIIKLYHKLRKINPAPFACYLNFGDLKILSTSPERFLSISSNRQIEACPIKGTIKRSQDPQQDANLAAELFHSEKNQAENIMIVDLMRSDLSKICIPNSVNVQSLCKIETFTNVHHLVSRITGTLNPQIHSLDIINAAFPGGSITGAPKIRSMQIIDELEPITRGIYCGSIGYFGFNGSADLSISIRTLVITNNVLSYNVGGAITLDSDPEEEYQESLLKGQKLYEALNDSSY